MKQFNSKQITKNFDKKSSLNKKIESSDSEYSDEEEIIQKFKIKN